MSSRVTQHHLDSDHVWYVERYDIQTEEWVGIAPYEYNSEREAYLAYLEHKKAVPGGDAHVVREDRSRYVVCGPVKPQRPLSTRNQNES